MNNNTNFDNALKMMWSLQNSIITVEMLKELFYDECVYTNHIIIPDGMDKVTDFMFVQHRCQNDNFLAGVTSLDMSFEEALMHFSKKTIRSPGAILKLDAN